MDVQVSSHVHIVYHFINNIEREVHDIVSFQNLNPEPLLLV